MKGISHEIRWLITYSVQNQWMGTDAKFILSLVAAAAIALLLISGVVHTDAVSLLWDLLLLSCVALFCLAWIRLTTQFGARHLVDGIRRKDKR